MYKCSGQPKRGGPPAWGLGEVLTTPPCKKLLRNTHMRDACSGDKIIFGPRRDEVTGEWRELRNEELNDLYCSPNIVRVIKSRRMRWTGHMARMGERGVNRVLVGKREGRRPLGRPRRRWVDNIRMELQEVGCGYMDWTGLAQDRDRWRTLVSAVMNLRVP